MDRYKPEWRKLPTQLLLTQQKPMYASSSPLLNFPLRGISGMWMHCCSSQHNRNKETKNLILSFPFFFLSPWYSDPLSCHHRWFLFSLNHVFPSQILTWGQTAAQLYFCMFCEESEKQQETETDVGKLWPSQCTMVSSHIHWEMRMTCIAKPKYAVFIQLS